MHSPGRFVPVFVLGNAKVLPRGGGGSKLCGMGFKGIELCWWGKKSSFTERKEKKSQRIIEVWTGKHFIAKSNLEK